MITAVTIFPAQPQPGQIFTLCPILPEGEPYQVRFDRIIERKGWRGDSGFYYTDIIAQFTDTTTGEILIKAIEWWGH